MRLLHLLTVTVILTSMFALPATADDTTTTTTVLVEVCRDDQLITIPVDQVLETDDPVFNDFQRDNCQPRPATVPNPTLPGPTHVRFPAVTVGYACPGTDGVIVELPWGSYEDMWPTIELAALYGCPKDQPVVNSPTVAPVVAVPVTVAVEAPVVETLPFTGPSDTAGLLTVGLVALLVGGLLVGLARRPV